MNTQQEETVTLSKKDYDFKQTRLLWLSCLEDAGIDNWQGCEQAIAIYNSKFTDKK